MAGTEGGLFPELTLGGRRGIPAVAGKSGFLERRTPLVTAGSRCARSFRIRGTPRAGLRKRGKISRGGTKLEATPSWFGGGALKRTVKVPEMERRGLRGHALGSYKTQVPGLRVEEWVEVTTSSPRRRDLTNPLKLPEPETERRGLKATPSKRRGSPWVSFPHSLTTTPPSLGENVYLAGGWILTLP